MANVIELIVQNETELRAKILGTADRLQLNLMRALDNVNTQLQRHIVSDKLSGQVLKSHTGNLKRSIIVIPATVDGEFIVGKVGLAKEAWYGKIHEYGGVFSRKGGGSVSFPERSFMRSGFADMRDQILEALIKAAEMTS